MATTAEAIEAIATATGIPRVTVERAAVILRTAPGDLWPTGGRGGGIKAARPTASHLVNLGLAIAAADPLNEAPDLVRRYRDLVPAPPNRLWIFATLGPDPEDWARSEKLVSEILDLLCPGPTLGDGLDRLMHHLMSAEQPLARMERRDFARKHLTSITVWRYRFRGGAIGARLVTSAGSRSFQEPVGGLLPLMEEGLEDQGIPVAAALDSTSIACRIFEIMADLAHVGKRGRNHKPSPDAAGDTAAKDVETTTPAAVGAGPAPIETASQPGANPVNPAERDSQQDRSMREREQSSSSSAALTGSPSSDPTDQTKGGHHGQAEDFRHAAQPEHQVRR
jgi:hypothetical protein